MKVIILRDRHTYIQLTNCSTLTTQWSIKTFHICGASLLHACCSSCKLSSSNSINTLKHDTVANIYLKLFL